MKKPPKQKVQFAPEEQPSTAPVVSNAPPQMLIGESGKWFEFPGGSVDSALQSGFRYPTPQELTERENEAKWGDRPVLAGAIGALRGFTLGGSDLAYRGAESLGVLPQGTTEAIHQIGERNKGASLVGEIGSFVVPGIGAIKALGTAGKVAQGLGAAQAGLGAIGTAAGKTAAKIVGERLGVVAAPVAKMASEAALFQVAHNLSEAALKDEELTAENVFANIGHAAEIGGGLGLALPVFAKGAQLAGKVLDKGIESAVKQTAKFFDPDRSLRLYSGAMGNSRLLEDTIVGNKFKDGVEHLKKIGFYGEGKQAVDASGKFAKIAEGGLPSSEQAYERLERGLKDTINLRSNVLSEVDKYAAIQTQLKAKLSAFPESAEQAILKRIDDMAANGIADNPEALKATLNWGKSLFEAKQGSLAGLEQLKEGLYERIGKGYEKIGDAEMRVLKDLARTVKTSIETGVKVARESDPVLAKSLAPVEDLNKTLAALSTIKGPIDKLRQKGEANVNVLGLRWRDMLAGMGGSAVGGAVAGPVGAAVGGMAGVANKMLQTDTGLLMRAKLGEQIAAMSWANGLNVKTADKVSSALKGFMSSGGKQAELAASNAAARSTPAQRREASRTWFAETQRQIMRSLENPDALQSNLERQLNGFQSYAPGVADAMINKQTQILGYLADRMPRDPTMSLNPFKSDWEPSESEVYKFKQLVRTVREPMTVLEDFKQGTLTRDQVQAVSDLYPRIYGQIVEQATQMAMNNSLPYQKKVQLSTLLGVPLDNTMRPQFVQRMQAAYGPTQEQQMRANQKKTGFSQRQQSATERAANR